MPGAYVAVEVDEEVAVPVLVVRAKELLEGLGRLPGIVVRNLGRDVVRDVGLADTVEEVGTDEAKAVAVDRGESALGSEQSEFVSRQRRARRNVAVNDRPWQSSRSRSCATRGQGSD